MGTSKSARGTVVDFDLLKIREQIGKAQPPVTITQREQLIEQKLKRRTRKATRKQDQ